MVHYDDDDIIILDQFGGERMLIPRLSKRELIRDVLARVTLLRRERGRELFASFPIFMSFNKPFDWDRYHVSREIVFGGDKLPEDRRVVERWLIDLPINSSTGVYVFANTAGCATSGCPVFAVQWHDFATSVWWAVWHVFGIICVLDDTTEWAVMFGPEPCGVFIVPGGVDLALPKSDGAYGLSLIRAPGGPPAE